jgi:hypothetical protein
MVTFGRSKGIEIDLTGLPQIVDRYDPVYNGSAVDGRERKRDREIDR